MHILVVEDEPSLARFLKSSLESQQFRVDLAESEAEARQKLTEQHDLILLDLKIPGVEGYELLCKARELQPFTPILILSGMNNLEDRVRGLELGADDYLAKPFALAELLVRIRNLLRRASRLPDVKTCIDDLELNHMDRIVQRGGKRIDLSPKEYALLEYLMRHSNQCVTRTMIIQNVWGFSPDTMTNVVDVYISYLRRKIDDGFGRRLIHTVRGEGYEIGLRPEGEPAGLSRKAAATGSHAHLTGHS
jgi:two-component system copper resistance phosphate regulon response regulator CusR